MRYSEDDKVISLDSDPKKNYISIDNSDRFLAELYLEAGSGKGKNSSVFRVIDPNKEEPDCVIKFCNYHDHLMGSVYEKKRMRFEREIRAMKMAIDTNKEDFLLNLIAHGTERIQGFSFKYYVMESADNDLGRYLEDNRLTLQQKILLCADILNALKALHELGIYHRDLKPDNIFFVGDQWKIGDLGFIAFRDDDFDLDGRKERIGPTGLMSPEATNKAFANTENSEFEIDCIINEKSDIFQIGKLFWYILQGDLPTGQVIIDDFKVGDAEIFSNVIFPMLQNAKGRRPSIDDLKTQLTPIRERLLA